MRSLNRDDEPLLWIYPKIDPSWAEEVMGTFHIHPAAAQVLVSRGFRDIAAIHHHLYAQLPNLENPQHFPEIGLAVSRILQAIKQKEKILIHGDNDVDGMTGTALLVEFLQTIGANVLFYIPYLVPNEETSFSHALKYAENNQCSLLITVDCSLSSHLELKSANKKNIDIIVTDHHEPLGKQFKICAFLNPKIKKSTPIKGLSKELTGVGVAFKLAHAITNKLLIDKEIEDGFIDLKSYLDLVALGTIADMGVILGENRILVRYGLREIQRALRIGLQKLCEISDIKAELITPIEIATKIAPRLNSLGRIGNPNQGVELLLCKDEGVAQTLAQKLDENNVVRQQIERKDSEWLEKYLAANPNILKNRAIAISSEHLHPGVIPILTARLAKQYHRPTVLIACEDGKGKGSIRTIPQFPILPVLQQQAHLLENFGGHDYAAGFLIETQHIKKFTSFFVESANYRLIDEDLSAKLAIDGKIDFSDLTFDFMESMYLLEPFGNGNPHPIFYSDAKQSWPPKIIGKNHLKFYLEQGNRRLEGIGFGMASHRSLLMKPNLRIRIAFTPQINTFLNKDSIQLNIKDFKLI